MFKPAVYVVLSKCPLIIEAEWRMRATANNVNIGADNSIPPARHQAILYSNQCLLIAN